MRLRHPFETGVHGGMSARMRSGMQSVDAGLLRNLQPHVKVKGEDWLSCTDLRYLKSVLR